MLEKKDIRWQQRFTNYQKALISLTEAVSLANSRELSNLEKQGLIQGFEFTHELAWKTIKDFFVSKGNSDIYGSKDATKQAFNNQLISDGETWFAMIESRNLSSHTYDNTISDEIANQIIKNYFPLFIALEQKLNQLKE